MVSARFFRLASGLILLGVLGAFARADVSGSVTLKGPPNSQDETFLASASGCGESPVRHTENWKVGSRGELADVVVWMVDPRFGPMDRAAAPMPEAEIRQIGCRYEPHVLAVVAGQPFKIINGDPTLHNILAKAFLGL